ncbi:MAG: hypothetical protein C4B59_10700 [Candidatus Methanogaster sp.]|uniref:Uncharacterized protein n=1 Tax=Candidatus Methanogaster sp. TaxID=3386292 RepID=A0AC61L1E1_9EURY|nr:MAG: hypothetical protein C4B59_10700 [ANME-2 cluster archaeon]
MQTRHYVHGKILWAALTARLTRDHDNGADGQAYKTTGDDVKKHFRFGYLWPAIPCGDTVRNWDDVKTLFPSDWNGADLECLKKIFPHPKVLKKDEPTFDYLFLDSYASTASSPHSRGALEGSLHDTEFITPRTRDDGRQVYLAGSLWVKAEELPEKLERWKDKLNDLRFGGEGSYGWGRVQQIYCAIERNDPIDPTGFSWSGPIPAHVEAEGAEQMIQGPIEPLVGWEMQKNGGQKPGEATIAFIPGYSAGTGTAKFAIGMFGVWTVKYE